jgi:thiamine-phosphate pyrophosphorylase
LSAPRRPPAPALDWSLVAILDREWFRGRSAESLAKDLIRGGATVLQYRDKVSRSAEMFWNAAVIRKITRDLHVPFFINDRLDIAMACEADGVHVGQEDLPVPVIRKLAPGLLVGVTAGRPDELERSPDADYYGIGAVFPTGTKPDASVSGLEFVRAARRKTAKPLVGIGGITASNAAEAFAAGCDGVAAISTLLRHKDVVSATRRLRETILRFRGMR